MTFYQYKDTTEAKFISNPMEMKRYEKEEEEIFKHVLGRENNRLIDLLDLYFPPSYRKINCITYEEPRLPQRFRKKAIELLREGMRKGKVSFDLNERDMEFSYSKLLAKKDCYFSTYLGQRLVSAYAVVDYDCNNQAIVETNNILASVIATETFIEFLVENDIFPFELLNYPPVWDVFECWNHNRLVRLANELKNKDYWSVVDAVSIIAGFFVEKRWVANKWKIDKFPAFVWVKPLRHYQEHLGDTASPLAFDRVRGDVDQSSVPKKLIEQGEVWNKALDEVTLAMSFDEITHNARDNFKSPKAMISKKSFINWAKNNGFGDVNKFLTSSQKGKKAEQEDRLLSLLKKVVEFAKSIDIEIVLNEFPGTKNELSELIKSLDQYFVRLRNDTLADYYKKLGIKFKAGNHTGKCEKFTHLRENIFQQKPSSLFN